MSRYGKRRGSVERRRAEFAAISQAVRKNKARFIRRLQGLVRVDGTCVRFLGSHTKDGYGRMNLTYISNNHRARRIQIYAQRLFLILKLGRSIKMEHDAGHEEGCPHRDCVLHLFEQHWVVNSQLAFKKNGQRDDTIPF
jgi:hypothetical protein